MQVWFECSYNMIKKYIFLHPVKLPPHEVLLLHRSTLSAMMSSLNMSICGLHCQLDRCMWPLLLHFPFQCQELWHQPCSWSACLCNPFLVLRGIKELHLGDSALLSDARAAIHEAEQPPPSTSLQPLATESTWRSYRVSNWTCTPFQAYEMQPAPRIGQAQ